ncbi:MAG: hypothetical protein U5L96_07030 [Owenweeksia sp.]|nr:hypothetical protein [Owenweeksia sp.]
MKKVQVAVIGYGVIGKRVAGAVALQEDMELAGVADVISDWRIKAAVDKGYTVYAATAEARQNMEQAGISVAGNMDDLLEKANIAVDCTPKKIAAQNVETYKKQGLKFILQGGEKHEVTGHSFSAKKQLRFDPKPGKHPGGVLQHYFHSANAHRAEEGRAVA